MKSCGCRNVRKQKDIQNGEKYITFDISLNFGSLEKMKITSSEPRDYLGRSGKGLVTCLGINYIRWSKKIKKARFSITNVSFKDISNIIKEFENLSHEGYVRKRPKNMPTNIYLYLSRHLAKCMIIFNMRIGPVITQMTNMQKMINYEMSTQKIPNLRVCYLYESE